MFLNAVWRLLYTPAKRKYHISLTFLIAYLKVLKHKKPKIYVILEVVNWQFFQKNKKLEFTLISAASREISALHPLRYCREVSNSFSLPMLACRQLYYHFEHSNGCSLFLYCVCKGYLYMLQTNNKLRKFWDILKHPF